MVETKGFEPSTPECDSGSEQDALGLMAQGFQPELL